ICLGDMLEGGIALFIRFGQGKPGSDARQFGADRALGAGRAFGMDDAVPCRHQIDRAGLDHHVAADRIAVADRAYQHASAYAAERVQSRPVDGSSREAVPIIQHPDVRRMSGTMRASTEAGRASAYYTAGHADSAHASADPAARARHSVYSPQSSPAAVHSRVFESVSVAARA
ncbi:hypothetical protein OY671_010132, partial [Metschnikowia pulcherrima]